MIRSKRWNINIWAIMDAGFNCAKEFIIPSSLVNKVANNNVSFHNEVVRFNYDARSF